MLERQRVDASLFNEAANLPYSLRLEDFQIAMQDVYDFFFDVNQLFYEKHLPRLDDLLRPANMSGLVSDMLTASVAKHSRSLVQNIYPNGHPDLIVEGVYSDNRVLAGEEGVEIKATTKKGGAVDTHGGRDQWMCVFVFTVDRLSQPARNRKPMLFTEIYLSQVVEADFRKNARGERGTRTATLHADGVKKLRSNWIYKLKTT